MNKKQSETIHIGNIGEHIIGTMLSPHCIVRNVTQGRDTGIDLYCEILKEGSLEPLLHFFCQVKTSINNVKLSEIEKHFDYWGNQPVPVFLLHVKYKKGKTPNEESEVWVYDIPYLLAIEDAKKSNQKIKRDVDTKFLLCEEHNNKDKMTLDKFIYSHIPWSYGLWQMRRYGLIYPNPKIREKDDDIFVGGFTKLYENKINQSMKYTDWLIQKDKKNLIK